MRRFLILIAFVSFCACPAWAEGEVGSVFGTLTTARTVGQGGGEFGVGAGFADATSFFGTFAFGVSRYTDLRFKLGFHDDLLPGDDIALAFGTDFKWQFWNVRDAGRPPLDMAVGALFEYIDGENFSAFDIGGHLIGSYPFGLSNNMVLSPYGRINVRLETVSIDVPGFSDDDSDLEFGINGGVGYTFTRTVNGFVEFQIDGNDGIFLGVSFLVM